MDKESIIDELFGAIAGLFLFYGISPEKGSGKIITDLLKRVEELLQRKTAECEELKEKLEYKHKECLAYDKSIQKWHKRYEDSKKRISDLEDRIMNHSNTIEKYCSRLADKTKECEELKKKLMQKSEVDMFFNTPVNGWSNNPCDICECKQALEPFEDEYFKGLNTTQIAGLAKKSIRLTTENRKFEDVLDEIEEYCKNQISLTGDLPFRTTESDILDIISKAKGVK